jgi:hypothetical protein
MAGLGKIIGWIATIFISPIKTIYRVIILLGQLKQVDKIVASNP